MIQSRGKSIWVVCRTCLRPGPHVAIQSKATACFDAIEAAEQEGWVEIPTPPIPGFVMYCPGCRPTKH